VGLAEGVAAGARRVVAHGRDLTLWVACHMALPKGLGKHLRGSAGGHLGHAILRDLSAPPFCAAWPTVAKSIVAPQP
jgi:hypothetical protein